MKIGATNAVTAAVVAEFVASNKGLGYLLLEYNGDLETAAVFATVAVLSVFGLALYYLVELAERLAHIDGLANISLTSRRAPSPLKLVA